MKLDRAVCFAIARLSWQAMKPGGFCGLRKLEIKEKHVTLAVVVDGDSAMEVNSEEKSAFVPASEPRFTRTYDERLQYYPRLC